MTLKLFSKVIIMVRVWGWLRRHGNSVNRKSFNQRPVMIALQYISMYNIIYIYIFIHSSFFILL